MSLHGSNKYYWMSVLNKATFLVVFLNDISFTFPAVRRQCSKKFPGIQIVWRVSGLAGCAMLGFSPPLFLSFLSHRRLRRTDRQ